MRLLSATAALALVTGCVTHRVNWNARLGSFNYDQAVIELGPPDKQAKLSDGRTIAEWVSRYDTGSTVVLGGGFYHSPAGINFVETSPHYYESRLRLTFNTNNILSDWSKK